MILSQRVNEIIELAWRLRKAWDINQVFDTDLNVMDHLDVPGYRKLRPGWHVILKKLAALMDIPLTFSSEVEDPKLTPRSVFRLLIEAEGFIETMRPEK